MKQKRNKYKYESKDKRTSKKNRQRSNKKTKDDYLVFVRRIACLTR